nr:hypothetical protein [Marinicella sp. W31]MDC2878384.1 hypothetical protein [Marinicella sp. W31]
MLTYAFEQVEKAEVFKIAPTDTNYFAILFDPKKDGIDNIFVIEIFTVGGATPRTSTVMPMNSSMSSKGRGLPPAMARKCRSKRAMR